jgi:hypothetical protein
VRCPGVASATLTVVLLVASGCSSDAPASTASSTPGAIATVPSTRPDTSTTTWATAGLPDEELIAIALGALEAEGTPVGDDREPLVRRGATEVEISFPTRADLPPVIGGEPHVHLEPSTGAVLRITRTR